MLQRRMQIRVFEGLRCTSRECCRVTCVGRIASDAFFRMSSEPLDPEYCRFYFLYKCCQINKKLLIPYKTWIQRPDCLTPLPRPLRLPVNMALWKRLIRFKDASGTIRYGEPDVSDAFQVQELLGQGKLKATGLDGSDPFDLQPTAQKYAVKELLGILEPENVPLVKCIGLNYMKHSKYSP